MGFNVDVLLSKKINTMYLRIVLGYVLFVQCSSLFSQSVSDKNIQSYLDSAKRECLRYQPKDSGGIIGLPFPYYSPSPGKDAMFSELYYWDCFFTNRYGLLSSRSEEDLKMAVNQVDNFIHLVNQFGYVPNANRFSMLNRSQPPFLSLMVRDVFERTGDINWLGTAVVALEREYQFWMQNRMDSFLFGSRWVALNHYGHHAKDSYLKHFYVVVIQRLRRNMDSSVKLATADPSYINISKLDSLKQAAHWLAEAESGWDFTPRFSGRCNDFFPVDLNAILADYERNLHWMYAQLLPFETVEFEKVRIEQRMLDLEKAGAKRIQAMKLLMWNKEMGVYYDFDKLRGTQSTYLTVASFFPVWLGVGTQKGLFVRNSKSLRITNKSAETLLKLLSDDCLMPMEKPEVFTYRTQWNYGNVWPPFQAIAVESIRANFPDRYSFWASVIATSFCGKVEVEFDRVGQLKEKYGIGSYNSTEEYATPAMMGWTSAVYRYLKFTGY